MVALVPLSCEDSVRGRGVGNEPCLGHFRFEILSGHPSGEIRLAGGYMASGIRLERPIWEFSEFSEGVIVRAQSWMGKRRTVKCTEMALQAWGWSVHCNRKAGRVASTDGGRLVASECGREACWRSRERVEGMVILESKMVSSLERGSQLL